MEGKTNFEALKGVSASQAFKKSWETIVVS